MIQTRVEKLKFITEEMQISFYLTQHLTDPFVARTMARHILIRAENFIEHARGLRKPLTNAGYNTRAYHKAKEAYASAFEEYFKIARHKLGAHVQDFDFGRRIDLWNDIEIVKTSYFVDGAIEIYQSLKLLNLPGYIEYSEPFELTESGVLQTLRQYQRTIDNRNWVEMGADPLALTRKNTIATLNQTPVHVRAGQLALIKRWITIQNELLHKFNAYPRIVHVLKARIVTDIVSFCDCLVTRSVSSNALQAMDGLDRLIVASGESSATINNFVTASNFQAELLRARDVRDKIGGHVEIDDACTLTDILADLGNYDLKKGLDFFGRVTAVFTKTCSNIIFLREYAIDGSRLYGIGIEHSPAVTSYSGDNITSQIPQIQPSINDEKGYWANLRYWLDGDDAQKEEARHFFWKAFGDSQVVETVEEVERIGSGQKISKHEFRKAHQFFSSVLSDGISDFDFQGIIGLFISCGRGWPYPLAEILVRHGRNASGFRQWLACYALGWICSSPHAIVSKFLEECADSPRWAIRHQAALARFKTFVQTEGLYRLNHKGQTTASYDALVNSLLSQMSAVEQLICQLAFASILSSPYFGTFLSPFQSNYESLQNQIESLCLPFLEDNDDRTKADTLKKLIKTHDYVGTCLLVALECNDEDPVRKALIENCCNGSIAVAGHDQAKINLANCFVLKQDYQTAYEITQEIASKNPEWIDIQVRVAEILASTPSAEEKALQEVDRIRHAYRLTTDLETRLKAIEMSSEDTIPNSD